MEIARVLCNCIDMLLGCGWTTGCASDVAPFILLDDSERKLRYHEYRFLHGVFSI